VCWDPGSILGVRYKPHTKQQPMLSITGSAEFLGARICVSRVLRLS